MSLASHSIAYSRQADRTVHLLQNACASSKKSRWFTPICGSGKNTSPPIPLQFALSYHAGCIVISFCPSSLLWRDVAVTHGINIRIHLSRNLSTLRQLFVLFRNGHICQHAHKGRHMCHQGVQSSSSSSGLPHTRGVLPIGKSHGHGLRSPFCTITRPRPVGCQSVWRSPLTSNRYTLRYQPPCHAPICPHLTLS